MIKKNIILTSQYSNRTVFSLSNIIDLLDIFEFNALDVTKCGRFSPNQVKWSYQTIGC